MRYSFLLSSFFIFTQSVYAIVPLCELVNFTGNERIAAALQTKLAKPSLRPLASFGSLKKGTVLVLSNGPEKPVRWVVLDSSDSGVTRVKQLHTHLDITASNTLFNPLGDEQEIDGATGATVVGRLKYLPRVYTPAQIRRIGIQSNLVIRGYLVPRYSDLDLIGQPILQAGDIFSAPSLEAAYYPRSAAPELLKTSPLIVSSALLASRRWIFQQYYSPQVLLDEGRPYATRAPLLKMPKTLAERREFAESHPYNADDPTRGTAPFLAYETADTDGVKTVWAIRLDDHGDVHDPIERIVFTQTPGTPRVIGAPGFINDVIPRGNIERDFTPRP